ncbi:MAG: hypothetical protein A2Z02_07270 [Chloroflexi bacterium RBG_16_48_7]|nr:MAG: hypothetical protein A2Z02_07270 [Chloroflexi bacterium RBG_16_48_7]
MIQSNNQSNTVPAWRDDRINVIIGTLVHSQGAYILPRFLANLKNIQELYPASRIAIATSEESMADGLPGLLASIGLEADIIPYRILKPSYARDRIWNIACGREAIREYFLSLKGPEYLLFIDCDMTFDPSIINIMEREIHNYDLLFSGYPLKKYGIGLAGCGCMIARRQILAKVRFRCYEFENHEVIFEDNLLEMDAYLLGARIKKGIFVYIEHYSRENDYRSINPRPVGLFKRTINNSAFRCYAIKASVFLKYNLLWNIKKRLDRNL